MSEEIAPTATVKGFAMTAQLAQAVINYLAQHPFGQVEQMIVGMRAMDQIDITVKLPVDPQPPAHPLKSNGKDPDPPEA